MVKITTMIITMIRSPLTTNTKSRDARVHQSSMGQKNSTIEAGKNIGPIMILKERKILMGKTNIPLIILQTKITINLIKPKTGGIILLKISSTECMPQDQTL